MYYHSTKTGLALRVIALLWATMLIACTGNGSKQEVSEQPLPEGVTCREAAQGVALYGITDREGEQAVDLFRGQNDSLLSTLVADGQTGFRSAFNVFVAVAGKRMVVFDAGIGTQAGGNMIEKLQSLPIEAEQIDICLTHLHFDHIGGLLNNGEPVFPTATIHLSQSEYDAWADDERWQAVQNAYKGRIETFSDSATLCDGLVQSIPAYGHTPGHTLYRVGNCLIVGDLLHAQDLQIEHPEFCARYDADPTKAREVRCHVYDLVRTEGYYMCCAHCYDHFITLNK